MSRLNVPLLFALVLGLSGFALKAEATPLKTDAGTPIASATFNPGFTQGGLTFPAGLAIEDGTKVTQYIGPVTQPTPAINNALLMRDQAMFPGITPKSDATPNYDCHGLTFKSGKLFISDTEVDKILTDQKWKKRGAGGVAAKAQVGDIVIYRNPAARTASHPTDITHSGIVTKVDAQGNITEVHSKWGVSRDYLHALRDVPPPYLGMNGTIEVWTGGAPLKDSPLTPEDINVFDGHTPPPLKPAVSDLLSGTSATIFDDLPITSLRELTDGPTNWEYALSVPLDGLTISTGDKLDLFGTGWTSALVTGTVSLPNFGGWIVGSVSANLVEFDATSSASVPGDFAGLLDGFTGISSPSGVGEIPYTETVAGSVGLVSGPVRAPEPCTLLLLATGFLGVFAYGRRAR